MTILVYAVIALCTVAFVCATIARAVTYARHPIHLRWELYPVPHERPERVAHGGSYFEQSEWWLAPRRPNLGGELAVMVPEILFLNGLREFNRRLWLRSFPFHLGLYLIASAGMGLLVMAGVARLVGLAWLGGPVGHAAGRIVAVTGSLGLVLAILGALALLHRRVLEPSLRAYTTVGDVFNLVFFAAALGTLGVGYFARPGGSPGALSIVIGLLSWDHSVRVPPLLAAGLVSTAALIAYIPFTHMAHFIGKYFTYHAVRWDDAPLGRDPKMSAALAEYLTYRPTWAAGHIKAKGTPTWGEVVTTNPTDEGRR